MIAPSVLSTRTLICSFTAILVSKKCYDRVNILVFIFLFLGIYFVRNIFLKSHVIANTRIMRSHIFVLIITRVTKGDNWHENAVYSIRALLATLRGQAQRHTQNATNSAPGFAVLLNRCLSIVSKAEYNGKGHTAAAAVPYTSRTHAITKERTHAKAVTLKCSRTT